MGGHSTHTPSAAVSAHLLLKDKKMDLPVPVFALLSLSLSQSELTTFVKSDKQKVQFDCINRQLSCDSDHVMLSKHVIVPCKTLV